MHDAENAHIAMTDNTGITAGVRAYHPTDYCMVRDIYLDTAYMGKRLTEAFFSDFVLFALLYLDCYATHYPEHFFVYDVCITDGRAIASDSVDNNGVAITVDNATAKDHTVCGYINGALDTCSFMDTYRKQHIPHIERRIHEQSTPAKEREIVGRALDAYRATPAPSLLMDVINTYPAHLHINVLPKAQRKGIGGVLLRHYEQYCRAQHARGIHLITSDNNVRALPFYEAHGYSLALRMKGSLWPTLSANSLVYTKLL